MGTKIAVHEALLRVRRRGRFVDLDEGIPALPSPARGPEQRVADSELGRVLEAAGATAAFQFGFSRCDRVVAAVLARIGAGKP